jgi:hypothetical protein
VAVTTLSVMVGTNGRHRRAAQFLGHSPLV